MRKRSLKALSGLMTILFALTTIAFPIGPFALQPKAAQATSGVSQGVSSGKESMGQIVMKQLRKLPVKVGKKLQKLRFFRLGWIKT